MKNLPIWELSIELKTILNNAKLIVKDTYSYTYLTSEHSEKIKNLDLGSGTFTSAIALFSLLWLVSKVYNILKHWDKNIMDNKKLEEYKSLKKILKESNKSNWGRIKVFFKKPRIWEINETESFIELIQDTDIELWIDKNNRWEIEKVWNSFRNQLIHMISLSWSHLNGEMFIETIIKNWTYIENLAWIKSRYPVYPAFDIRNKENKEIFQKSTKIDNGWKRYLTNDLCYIEQLKVVCELLIDWLINKINSNDFSYWNMLILNEWLKWMLKFK